MRKSLVVSLTLAVAIASAGLCGPARAASSGSTIKLISTFDYTPISGSSLVVLGINNAGDIVGQVIPPTGDSFGFERFNNGAFAVPIAFPGADSTTAYTINDSGTIVGGWQSAATLDSFGFFLQGIIYTSYSSPLCTATPCTTGIVGINDS